LIFFAQKSIICGNRETALFVCADETPGTVWHYYNWVQLLPLYGLEEMYIMCRKLIFLVSLVVLLGLVNGASAGDINWTGNGANDSWCTPANWDLNRLPDWELDWEVEINPVTPRDPVIDCDVDVGYMKGPRYDSDSDQSLDIESGTIWFWCWRMGAGGSGASIVNITGGDVTVWSDNDWAIRAADSGSLYWNQSGGTVTLPNHRFRTGDGSSYSEFNISGSAILSIGDEWKWGDEGDVLMNMSGGSIDIGGHWSMHCRDFSNTDVNMTGGDIWVGGSVLAADSSDNTLVATINLKAGTIDADSLLLPTEDEGTGILNMTGGSFNCRSELRVPNVSGGTGEINLDGGTLETASFYIDEGGTLDINDGILIIDGDVVADIIAGINAGYITGRGGSADVIATYDPAELKTSVWVVPAVSFETAASSGLETVSPAVLTVVLHNPPESNTVTVEYAATGGTAIGDGNDYTLNPGTLTFNPGGPTSQTIEITIIDDGLGEENETIEVTLSEPNNAKLGALTQHTYTIIDPRPYVKFDAEASYGNENISPAEIPVSLSWESTDTVTVDYSVTGGTAVGGGEDYNLPAGTLQFDPYQLTNYISITIVEDDLDELPDETVEITLSNPSTGKLGTITQHTFTIRPPTARLCPEGDLDGDCDVDFNDLEVFVKQWLDPSGSCSDFNCADLDGAGGVNMCDYAFLAENWLKSAWPIVINEFMASNDDTLEDPCDPNEFPDWFELYNASPIPLDLGGMYLTDDLSEPTMWQIPTGVTIDAGGFLVFYADDDDEQEPMHTNFKLSAGGEEIALFDTDGSTLIDSIEFGSQVSDISYGLYPDSSSNLRFFGIPTPGWENCGGYLGMVDDTQFSYDRGFYESAFNLSITCDTSGTEIYFTLNGSEPNQSVGELYTSPFDVNQTTVLRAVAYKPGYLPSNVDTQTYIFVDDVVNQPDLDDDVLTQHGAGAFKDGLKAIPTLSIVMDACDLANLQRQDSRYWNDDCDDDDCLPKKELPTSAELIYPDPNDGEGLQINCAIEGHSWKLDKTSCKLIFNTEFGPSQLRYPFFESAPFNSDTAVEEFDRIVLRASKNMPSTYVGDQWTRDTQIAMSGVSARGIQVHLYLNGTYWGIYNPTERPCGWFTSSYFGGEKEDYFATNHGYERGEGHISGDPNRFDTMISMAQAQNLAVPGNYDTFRGLCDVTNFADYTILFWFSGFGDTIDNNWYAGMRNVPLLGQIPPEGFMMFMWDAEVVFEAKCGPPGNEVPWVPPHYFTMTDHTIVDVWVALRDNEDFNLLFADRIYKHCFNDGVLTDDNTQARWNALTDDINDAAVCEVARWPQGGGYGDTGPGTVPPEHVDMTGFVGIFMTALDNWGGLYPSIDPPTMTPQGGYDPNGFSVTMSHSDTIYYTLDGSDPRQAVTGNPVGQLYTGPVMLDKTRHVKARAYNIGATEWSALNEAVFAVGPVADKLRITEIMYHPQDTNDPNDPNTEFIELKNIGPNTLNLNLVSFTNGVDFTFPADINIPAGGYVVVVKDHNAFTSRYPSFSGVIAGEYTGRLNNAGERIELQDALGQTILNFRYEDGWRDITDGDGFSLTIIDPNNADPNSWSEKDSWRASAYIGGSPGWDDSGIVPNPGAIVINELLAHSDGYPNDWIELYNTTAEDINISGWFLSDNDSNLMKYQLQSPTMILAGTHISFTQDDHFGGKFALSENGEAVYLSSAPDQNGVLTGYREVEDFGASENGVSFGRYYKSSTDNFNFVAMESTTRDSNNAYPRVGPIVINEIMYHPDWPEGGSLYNNDEFEYIELRNIIDADVNLYDEDSIPWKFTDGIEFTFPPITIPAGGYLLVVKNPEAFSWRYPNVPVWSILGPYDGQLNNAGEKVEISKPGDESGGIRYYIRVDRVNYSDGSHPEDCPGGIDLWPTEADGDGNSLTRIDPNLYGNDPNNWDANTPTPQSTISLLFVNEFMADNETTIRDDCNDYDDWIELYNGGTSSIDLAGMYLTDDLGVPNKWVIPGGVSIEAGGYLLFWADNEDGEGDLHTNFGLSKDGGEDIGLFDTDGSTLIDGIVGFPAQDPDESYGRKPDGGRNWSSLASPTPGSSN